ncbi:CheA signal transduction histidine kinase [Caldicellulosiruptor saccharolyticus DSM 8903]|uniref:Chemotaxis protein CheA n=1 Tax=Caldicellulosiruptor saccharolyticus (strain ATCC 43494 / DSM 8903 / Tp8T 6331) TaxID=351627 RepID=A4XHP2_CALS8|nr:chemotaxis protein CheA [Caldicellulosiruptor saccharolyticus]ABP66427.1 CheA signal transduction histidine kinase [Caldicellulosiruptor saccharolyticus DSM 8903]
MEEKFKDPLFEIFIAESKQLLNDLENIFICLKERKLILKNVNNDIMRIFHTLKGSSAAMKYSDISQVCHKAEDLFVKLNSIHITPNIVDQLINCFLKVIDCLNLDIDSIETTDFSASRTAQKLIDQLIENINENQNTASVDNIEKTKKKYRIKVFFEDGAGMENVRAYGVIWKLKDVGDIIDYTPKNIQNDPNTADVIQKKGFELVIETVLEKDEVFQLFDDVLYLSNIEIEFADNMSNEEFSQNGSKLGGGNTNLGQKIINVNVEKVDKIIDLIGELLINFSGLVLSVESLGIASEDFKKSYSKVSRVINELQEIAMSMRMVSLSNTFQRLRRVALEVSEKLHKKVTVYVTGEETELDRMMIEHITDPLIHLVRNAIDHGIETPDERRKQGKAEEGNLYIHAKSTNSEVLITIQDDGRGIDREKILEKALEKGIIKSKNNLTDEDIYSLIFMPGFSTKDEATEYSGRGVGLDIVKNNIERIGGKILVTSEKGRGTSFTLKIPLTLAIIDGMLVELNSKKFVIPITSMVEIIRLDTDKIILEAGKKFILLREECYPLVDLKKIFFGKETEFNSNTFNIGVMIEENGKKAVLLVDNLISQQQIVIKPLPLLLRNAQVVSGCTLLGDGSIALILDISGLFEHIRVTERRRNI